MTVAVVQPLADVGAFADQAPASPYVVPGTYYGRRHYARTDSRSGHVMHFAGWSYPLEDYVGALQAAGLAVTALREPARTISMAPLHYGNGTGYRSSSGSGPSTAEDRIDQQAPPDPTEQAWS